MRPSFSAIKRCALNVLFHQFLPETEVKKRVFFLLDTAFDMAILDLILFSPITKLFFLHKRRAANSR
jgi:hypothetical protein